MASSQTAPALGTGRSHSIDALRALAAFAVLLSHLPFTASVERVRSGPPVSVFPEWFDATTSYGQYGVHLFLVISGFAIHLAAARAGPSSEVSFVAFWKRRLLRLYPPYFVALLLTLGGLLTVYGPGADTWAGRFGYASGSQLVLDLVLLVLLFQNVNGASHRINNGPFWSLALEEQLYALYFPLLWLRRRLDWTRTIVIVAALTTAWKLLGYSLDFEEEWFVLGPARWLEWALGAVAVEAYVGRTTLPRWCSSPLVAALLLGTACVVCIPDLMPLLSLVAGDALFGIGFFVTINAMCERERLGTPASRPITWLARAGAWSYSLYLTHLLVMTGVKQLGIRVGLPIWAVAVGRVVLPLFFAYGYYLWIEMPFILRARRLAATTQRAVLAGAEHRG